MLGKIGITLLLAALVLSPGLALAMEDTHTEHSLEQLVEEMAHTPADHAALATHYRAKAAEARADAASHEKMAKSYALQKHGAADPMRAHCKKIAANSKATAAEYDALARLHDAESKKVK